MVVVDTRTLGDGHAQPLARELPPASPSELVRQVRWQPRSTPIRRCSRTKRCSRRRRPTTRCPGGGGHRNSAASSIATPETHAAEVKSDDKVKEEALAQMLTKAIGQATGPTCAPPAAPIGMTQSDQGARPHHRAAPASGSSHYRDLDSDTESRSEMTRRHAGPAKQAAQAPIASLPPRQSCRPP